MHDEALQILPDVLRQTGVKRPVLFGHSDGGSIALIFAAHFSDAVRAVITEAAHVMVEDVTIAGITDARRRFATGDLRARLARYHGAQTDVLFSRWSDVWCSPAFRGWDIRPLLSGIGCPTLAIQGCTDPYGTRAQAEAIVAGVTGGATALMLEGCGHAPHAEKPRDVMDAIAAFLDALPNESPV
jgi:pimeloyl-ACP methyl ester carboxylesterase